MVKKVKLNQENIWPIAFCLIIIFVLAWATFPPLLINPEVSNSHKAITISKIDPCLHPTAEHTPVYLRQGKVIKLTPNELTLQISPLANEQINNIKVLLTPDIPVVEIRVPSYINETLQEKVKKGEQVIERVPSTLASIHEGQKIYIVSANDTFCQKTITPARLEYDVIIDTSEKP